MKGLRILLNIFTKTKVRLLLFVINLISKFIPKSVISYLKIWFPLLFIIISYFRTFCFIVGCFFLLGSVDYTIFSIDNIGSLFKNGYYYIKYSFFYLVDSIFDTTYGKGKPKVDITIEPYSKGGILDWFN